MSSLLSWFLVPCREKSLMHLVSEDLEESKREAAAEQAKQETETGVGGQVA